MSTLNTQQLEVLYAERKSSTDQMAGHMDTLRYLAAECDTATEFGVRRANSTVALLCGVKCWLRSYDIEAMEKYHPLIERITAAAGPKWIFDLTDSREAIVLDTDMLVIDSVHTFDQCKAELDRHADKVSKYLVFHDTISNGSVGQVQKFGKGWSTFEADPQILGIRPAIDDLMIRDPSWFIKMSLTHHQGLLVLERR